MDEWRVPLGSARVPDEDLESVREVYRSGWLNMGPRTAEFETEFGAYTGAAHCVAVSSCSAALHLACVAVGIGPGDRVIVPSMTFVATVNAIAYCGAEPVFAEIAGESEPWLSTEAAEAAIDERTRAIMTVCYGGHPGEIESLRALADRRGLALLEDAAHGCGSLHRGRHLGTFGEVGAFSFSAAKNIGVGEGGMAVSDDAELGARLERLRWHGISSSAWSRHRSASSGYDVAELGFNYRIDDPRSALALVHLRRLEAETARRAEIDAAYRRDLAGLEGIEPTPPAGPDSRSSHLLFTVTLADGIDRDRLRAELAERGVQTSVHFRPAHELTLYARPELKLPLTESYGRRCVSLPIYPRMEEWQRELVVESIAEVLRGDAARQASPTQGNER
jgi:dTDP-4-amino-4,6-dideoxygalactose transaminase